MTNHLIVVRDVPFTPGTSVVARTWFPEDVEVTTNAPDFLCEDGDVETFEDRVEDKVVKARGRRPNRPAPPTEGVETK